MQTIFLQLFSSGLQQKEAESDGIMGYLKEDIRHEVKRASKLVSVELQNFSIFIIV